MPHTPSPPLSSTLSPRQRRMFRVMILLALVLGLGGYGAPLHALEWAPATGAGEGEGGLLFPGVAPAQNAPPVVTGTFHVRIVGEEVQGVLLLQVPPGWKLFHTTVGPEGAMDLPLELTFTAPGVTWGEPRVPNPRRYENRLLDPDPRQAWRFVHEGTIRIPVRGRVMTDAAPGMETIRVRVDGQMCSDTGQCVLVGLERAANTDDEGAPLQPDVSLFAVFESDDPSQQPALPDDATSDASSIDEAQPSPPDRDTVQPQPHTRDGEDVRSPDPSQPPATEPRVPADVDSSDPDAFVIRGQRDVGLVWTLLLAFLAGVILNFTPCVLPVIGIRIMALAQQRGEADARRGVWLGVVFAAGVLSVFLVLGILAAVFGQIWGQQFQSIPFLVALVSIVFAFSLSLFGVFEMFAPNVQAGGGGKAAPSRIHTTFLMGAVATLLATPCAGPLVGSTLAWALSQPWQMIMLVFTLMGVGMAMPYVVLTAHPAFLERMPKPGAWMGALKTGLGFFLLAAVVYLMRGLPAGILLQVMAYFLFVAVACRVWGVWGTPLRRRGTRARAGLAVVILLAGGWWFCFHVLGSPSTQDGVVVSAPAGTVGMWERFEPGRLEEARAAGRGVLLKWTADWCTNCKINDRLVYNTDEVRAAVSSSGVLALVADLTRRSPETEEATAWLRRLGGSAIPYAVVIHPDGRTVEPLPDLIRKETLLRLLDGLDAADPSVAAGVADALDLSGIPDAE